MVQAVQQVQPGMLGVPGEENRLLTCHHPAPLPSSSVAICSLLVMAVLPMVWPSSKITRSQCTCGITQGRAGQHGLLSVVRGRGHGRANDE